MAKRKNRKSFGKFFFKGISQLFKTATAITFKVAPFVIIVIGITAAFLGIRKMLYADTYLAIREISIQPSDMLSPEQIQSVESKWLWKNILTADINRIAADLEKNPMIQQARVTRRLPSKLEIQIRERKPIALVQFSKNGNYGLIANDGMILQIFKQPQGHETIMEAYGFGLTQPAAGYKFKHAAFIEASKFVDAYWELPQAQQDLITRIKLNAAGPISIVFGAGPEIRMGRKPLQNIRGLEKVGALLSTEERNKIEYIDLQYSDLIVKRKR